MVFIIIALFVSGELFKPKRKNIRMGRYLLFIIPLLMAFTLPPKALDTGSMSLSSINTMGRSDVVSPDSELTGGEEAYSTEYGNNDTVGNEINQNTGKVASNK